MTINISQYLNIGRREQATLDKRQRPGSVCLYKVRESRWNAPL